MRISDWSSDVCSSDLPLIDAVAQELTAVHADTVRALLAQAEVAAADIGVIGFHGHTVAHRPDRHWTWQIGDGAALARMTGITVVSDLRSADVAAGGQGAPLLPVYHRALAQPLEKPVEIGSASWRARVGPYV